MSVSPELVLQAYRVGVFPMAETRDDPDIFWVDPKRRGIIPVGGFRISRSLAKLMRKNRYRVTLDADFEAVIAACAEREETWINDEIRRVFTALAESGDAHSVEVWEETTLVGGVYGVTLGGVFCGESMFSRRRDVSKLALAFLLDHIGRCGFTLFDTQFLTDHLASLGGVEIPRAEYQSRLASALREPVSIHDVQMETDGQAVVQRNTQTS